MRFWSDLLEEARLGSRQAGLPTRETGTPGASHAAGGGGSLAKRGDIMRNAEEPVDTLEGMEPETDVHEEASEVDFFEAGESWQPVNGGNGSPAGSLLDADDASRMRGRWESVQAGFVDDPRRAVEQADLVVDMVVQRIAKALAEERDRLARSWDRRDGSTSTEDLRLAIQRYRSFLERLLTL